MTNAVKLAKRAIDVVASGVGLAMTVPLYPLIGAAIWLANKVGGGSIASRSQAAPVST